jgi:hypothetical protein
LVASAATGVGSSNSVSAVDERSSHFDLKLLRKEKRFCIFMRLVSISLDQSLDLSSGCRNCFGGGKQTKIASPVRRGLQGDGIYS